MKLKDSKNISKLKDELYSLCLKEPITFSKILAKDTWCLRNKILRPHQGLDACQFSSDNLEDSFHIGAFHNQSIVGIASVFCEAPPSGNSDKNKWRLRGMAVDDLYRSKGLGRVLLMLSKEYARQRGGVCFWCNARSTAALFYEKLGMSKVSEEFVIEGIGPHYVFSVDL